MTPASVGQAATNGMVKPDDINELASSHNYNGPTANHLGAEGEPNGSEAFSDTDSLLHDILNTDAEDDQLPDDMIGPEESAVLKAQLREVGPNEFVLANLTSGKYTAKKLVTAFGVVPPEAFTGRPDAGYFRLLGLAIVREIATRRKLPQYHSIDDAVDLLHKSKNILVITGAGISTNLGIPDFRSKRTGFYAQMREKGFDSPEDIFDIHTFDTDPSPFYQYSGQTLPAPGKTTPTHAFIKMLYDRGRLLTNYTQNIDNLESSIGLPKEKVIQCHGSWATFTCRKCNFTAPGERFFDAVREQRVAYCPLANCKTATVNDRPGGLKRKRSSHSAAPRKSRRSSDDDSDSEGRYDIPEPGVMKPNITFFGEKLPAYFFNRFRDHDLHKADLVIIIGTSMTVAPVSEIPLALPEDIPHIYISRDRVKHMDLDLTFLGDCDVIVGELARRAGWDLQHTMLPKGREVDLKAIDRGLAIWGVEPRRAASPEPERV